MVSASGAVGCHVRRRVIQTWVSSGSALALDLSASDTASHSATVLGYASLCAVSAKAAAEAAPHTAWDSWNEYMATKKKPVMAGSSVEKQYFM